MFQKAIESTGMALRQTVDGSAFYGMHQGFALTDSEDGPCPETDSKARQLTKLRCMCEARSR